MKAIWFLLIGIFCVSLVTVSCTTAPRSGSGPGLLTVEINEDSQCERADVFLDGRLLTTLVKGDPGKEFKMPCGYYEMRIVSDGFKPWEQTINVVGGNNYRRIEARMEKLIAMLKQICARMRA
jgi:hypothetical protein